jgi:hypothetical protein
MNLGNSPLRSNLPGPISYVTLWKFYFASIAALTLLDTCSGKEADFLLKFVEKWEINPQKFPTLIGATVTIPAKLLEIKVGSFQPSPPNPLQIQERGSAESRTPETLRFVHMGLGV